MLPHRLSRFFSRASSSRRVKGSAMLIVVLLVIEFLDEFMYGVREASWAYIRQDLNLTYAQIGVLIGIPGLIAGFIEPFFGIWSMMGYRRRLILIGGVFVVVELALITISTDFNLLLFAYIVGYPASGAFVGLAQTALMDVDPARHEHNMARWTLAGSVGIVAAPLLLGVMIGLGIGWRGSFAFIVVLVVITLVFTARIRLPLMRPDEEEAPLGFRQVLAISWNAVRRGSVMRWYVLLEFANLMMDVLHGFLALYIVDYYGADASLGVLAVGVWTTVGLVGDILIIPLLERVRGLDYLRVSAGITLLLFPAFLLAEPLILKLVLLGAIGFFNAGWYSILQGQVYSALPGQSGVEMTIGTVVAAIDVLIPLSIGLVAESIGLSNAIWILLLGPIALLIGIPRTRKSAYNEGQSEHETAE